MRNPFVVAKQLATVDQLSGGRLVVGLGAGWNEKEFQNVGADFHTRGRRLDEGIRLFQHLFAGLREPFSGRFYSYENGVFGPTPVHGAALPLLIGGTSEIALGRAASYGDLWESNPVIGPDKYPALGVNCGSSPTAGTLGWERESMRGVTRTKCLAWHWRTHGPALST